MRVLAAFLVLFLSHQCQAADLIGGGLKVLGVKSMDGTKVAITIQGENAAETFVVDCISATWGFEGGTLKPVRADQRSQAIAERACRAVGCRANRPRRTVGRVPSNWAGRGWRVDCWHRCRRLCERRAMFDALRGDWPALAEPRISFRVFRLRVPPVELQRDHQPGGRRQSRFCTFYVTHWFYRGLPDPRRRWIV